MRITTSWVSLIFCATWDSDEAQQPARGTTRPLHGQTSAFGRTGRSSPIIA